MTVRMRHTRAHSNNRRSHHSLEKPPLTRDESGALHLRHRLSPETGAYRGRKVLDMTAKAEKKLAKSKETAK